MYESYSKLQKINGRRFVSKKCVYLFTGVYYYWQHKNDCFAVDKPKDDGGGGGGNDDDDDDDDDDDGLVSYNVRTNGHMWACEQIYDSPMTYKLTIKYNVPTYIHLQLSEYEWRS